MQAQRRRNQKGKIKKIAHVLSHKAASLYKKRSHTAVQVEWGREGARSGPSPHATQTPLQTPGGLHCPIGADETHIVLVSSYRRALPRPHHTRDTWIGATEDEMAKRL